MLWLFKTEPAECSIDDIANAGSQGVIWEGVRNYQARNFLRDQVSLQDQVLIYHSSCDKIGIAGLGRITATAFADPSQFQPDSVYYDARSSHERFAWYAVKLEFIEKFHRLLTLTELRQHEALAAMLLLKKGNRLSVMPVTKQQFELVLFLTKT